MRSLILISVLLLVHAQYFLAQPTQTVRGKVVDQESQMPLVAANIMIIEAGPITGVITDDMGMFRIDDVPVGRYNIMISHLGYESLILRDVIVGTGKEVFLDIRMKELVLEMKGVSVSANVSKDQTINPMAGISARSFTVEETEKYAGSWGDPARMAANYAGVFENGDIYNYIVIRGNSPYGLVWRMEGIPVPNPNHFDVPGAKGGPISIINNKQLAQSDFLTGAFPASYSNGISGVFDLRLREGNNQRAEYVAELGLMGIELGAEGPFSKKKRASYLVNLRLSLLGLVDELLWVEALPRYQDFSFKLNFPTRTGKISVFGFGGSSRIIGVVDDSTASTPNYKHQSTEESGAKTGVIGIKHVHFLGTGVRLISDIAISTSRPYQLRDSMLNDRVIRNLTENRFREDRILVSSRLMTKLNAKNSLNFGVSLENNFVEYNLQNDWYFDTLPGGYRLVVLPPETLKEDYMPVFQGFAELKHRFTNTLTLYTGLNYMHFFMNGSRALEPRASLRWDFAEKHTLSLGYGLHSQLQPFFHYLTRTYTTDDEWDRDNYLESNRDLGFVSSHHLALGYDLLLTRDLRFKTEVYRQSLFNVPVEQRVSYFSLINTGAGDETTMVDSLVNNGTGRNYGIEFTFEKFLSNQYYFLLTASLLDSKYKGSDGVLRNTAFNSKFNVNALLGYELPVRENGVIDLNVRFVAAGGRRIIPLDEQRTIAEGDEVYIYDRAYKPRMADYYRLDVRAGYKYNGRRARHEIGTDITNITNRPNEWEMRYDENSNKIEIIYQQGIFFYIFYRINF